MIHDPKFWVSVSFITFLVLVSKPLLKFITSSLDGRATRIQNELEEAKRLRAEAQALLETFQKKHQESLAEAEAILAQARAAAVRMTETAVAELKASLEARAKAGTEKIARAEAQALKDVQGYVVDVAVSAARTLLADQAGKTSGSDAVAHVISQLERKLH